MPLPVTRSLYWSNIPPEVPRAQARVFEHLGLPLEQVCLDGKDHGEWMEEVLGDAGDDLVVFADIDAFPITRQGWERMVAVAEQGAIAGLAQCTAHLRDPDHIFAAPSFLALRRSVWQQIGRPSPKASKRDDVGQAITRAAESAGVPVETLLPTSCLKPMWNLAGRRVYGIGTFFGENEFFHLYQARKAAHAEVFVQVAEDVVAGRPLAFDRYMKTLGLGAPKPPFSLRRALGLK